MNLRNSSATPTRVCGVRRSMVSLIGITGSRAGNNPISTEQFSPGMLAAITKMLSDPEESWYVVDGR